MYALRCSHACSSLEVVPNKFACRLIDADGSGAIDSGELGSAFKVDAFLFLPLTSRMFEAGSVAAAAVTSVASAYED